jgi:hypothetical protein
MFRILILFINLMIFTSLQSQVYILEFVNPSQNAGSLTWTAQIRAISGSFVMGASNIRYNFNNSGLNPNSAPTFNPASGIQLDVTGFVGSAPNRVAVVSFSPTSSSGITVTTSPTVIGTITHNKLPNLPSGTLANVLIREWNVPGYTTNLPPPTPNQLQNCTLIYDASGDENIYQAGVPVNLDPNISLPVNLKSFSAEKAGERLARLDWVSATEINVSHYEVERSFDAMFFENIGKVDAVGNSTTESVYQLYDRKIPDVRQIHLFITD